LTEGLSYGKSLPWGGMDIYWNHTTVLQGKVRKKIQRKQNFNVLDELTLF